ncbi:MAG TPA: grasp-with-spasm system SPASM domain peptide maturase [Bacteroidia bacterium]|nr:grasp-with-spasm system SPASM domain peptide maturase [Bacteroidia bacterium]
MYIKLYACCIPVKGMVRSLICDIQRGETYFIPNALYEVLTVCRTLPIAAIHKKVENKKILNEYFEYLIKNELAFYTEKPSSFPDIALSFNTASRITNSIIDFDTNSRYNVSTIFNQLEQLGANAVQIRFFVKVNSMLLKKILMHTDKSRFRAIELVLPYQKNHNIENIIKAHPRISLIIRYNADENQHIEYSKSCNIILTKQHINNVRSCGKISSNYFSNNISSFTEALNHNSCLNRKISIDANGEIKNCPSMQESYGNIKDTTLEQALNKKGFKKYWNLTKDKINVCKDCEFRYICTDCRAYVEDPNDIYSKPLKCGYDPYTAKWEEWSTHPLKQKAIEYYGMEELIKTKY